MLRTNSLFCIKRKGFILFLFFSAVTGFSGDTIFGALNNLSSYASDADTGPSADNRRENNGGTYSESSLGCELDLHDYSVSCQTENGSFVFSPYYFGRKAFVSDFFLNFANAHRPMGDRPSAHGRSPTAPWAIAHRPVGVEKIQDKNGRKAYSFVKLGLQNGFLA